MSDQPYEPKTALSIEEAAKNLVNAIADIVHSTIEARAKAVAKAQATPGVYLPEDEMIPEARTLEYNADDREADANAEAEAAQRLAEEAAYRDAEREAAEAIAREEALVTEARDIVDRRCTNGASIKVTGIGRAGGLTAPLRGGRFTYPDSMRTFIAAIFREETSIDSLSEIALDGNTDISYSARRDRADGRVIILSCNKFPESIPLNVDDTAEAEMPL